MQLNIFNQLRRMTQGRLTRPFVTQNDTTTHKQLFYFSDGMTRSGMFCALYDVISRARYDQEIDVYLPVRQVRTIRQQAITSQVVCVARNIRLINFQWAFYSNGLLAKNLNWMKYCKYLNKRLCLSCWQLCLIKFSNAFFNCFRLS